MKSSRFSMFVSLLLIAGASAARENAEIDKTGGGEPLDGITLSLTFEKTTFTFGEPIKCQITMENTGKSEHKVFICGFFKSSEISVIKNKEAIDKTRCGNDAVYAAFRGEHGLGHLKPGQKKGVIIFALNRFYDMTSNGKYTVTASVDLPGEKKVLSNSVTISIEDPKDSRYIMAIPRESDAAKNTPSETAK